MFSAKSSLPGNFVKRVRTTSYQAQQKNSAQAVKMGDYNSNASYRHNKSNSVNSSMIKVKTKGLDTVSNHNLSLLN